MNSKKLKRLINKVRNELGWPSLEKSHNLPVIHVASNSKVKSHIILMPNKLHNRSSDMDYLHELGHATFCERIHPVFSVNIQCAPIQKRSEFLPLIPAINAACDWFIGHWQIELARKESFKLISENLKVAEEILASPELPPLEIILDASMLIAQAIHYLDEPVDCGGVLKNAVDAFLSIPPEKPTIENCVHLINLLLATYTDQRARLVNTDDIDAWEIYQSAQFVNSCEKEPGEQSREK